MHSARNGRSIRRMSPVELIVSVTAPLETALARKVEAKFHARLLEIYGSTETGQIALRRTSDTSLWRLWPEVRLRACNDQVLATGGHVEQLTIMSDVIEITGEDTFLLRGRTADLINVAGKRSSFRFLNAQLHAIPGVIDGVFSRGIRHRVHRSHTTSRRCSRVRAMRRASSGTAARADRSGVSAAAVACRRSSATQCFG